MKLSTAGDSSASVIGFPLQDSDNHQSSEVFHNNNSSILQNVSPKDDEQELMELMIASTTIPPNVTLGNSTKSKSDKTCTGTGGMTKSDAKKRAKQQRDLARDLSLLLPDNSAEQEEKAFGFAQAYYLKVRDRLDDNSFLEFVKALESFDNNSVTVCELYRNVISILKPFPDLSEEFVGFLLPEQAMELGVYMEYLCFTKMRQFLQKLEVYFSKQPQQMRKVYDCLTKLAEQSAGNNIDQSTVRKVILPLLKGSSLLTEYFLQLFPGEQPSLLECSDGKDFEKVDSAEFDECGTSGIHHLQDNDGLEWETVEIPDLEDPFGGDSCPCTCHSNGISSISGHCISCGIKFINGRVLVQNGKVLRPARLVVEDGVNKKDVLERICKKSSSIKDDTDEKGAPTIRPRKRPATDTSPVKNAFESEEDISDPKTPSSKVKSPRTIKAIKIIKTNCGRLEIDKGFSDKDKNRLSQTEEQNLNLDSFVLLDDYKNINRSNEEGESSVNLKESIEDHNVCDKLILHDDDDGQLSSPTVGSGDGNLIRDDEDDDIDYIDLDDIDDDAEEDIDVDDDDIEEDYEELVHEDDDDDDDIEEIEIDDEDADYLPENIGDDELSNDDDIVDDEELDNKDKLHEQLSINNKQQPEIDKNVKNYIDNSQENLLTEIKMEVVDNDLKESTETSTVKEHDSNTKTNPTNTVPQNSVELNVVPSTHVEEQPQQPSKTQSVSWTKEEDKVILQTFQQGGDSDQTFNTIREQLPQRSVDEIKSRFHILMLLLKRMTTNKNSTE